MRPQTVQQYMRALRRTLRSRQPVASDLVSELGQHLQDAYEEEVAQGTEPARAHQLAIGRFGDVQSLADRLSAEDTVRSGLVLTTKRTAVWSRSLRPKPSPGRPRTPGVAYGVLSVLLVVVVGSVALTARQTPPQTISEFAPQAVEQITDADAGLGDAGAGAASGTPSPEVDPVTGLPRAVAAIDVARVRQCVGDPPRQIEDPQSPPCVPYWSGDNGGATWRGVTRDEIRVTDPGAANPALQTFFNKRFEFYGRRIRLFPRVVGVDPVGQRAGARAAYEEDQAFASTGGCCLFHDYFDELARLGIVGAYFESLFPEAYLASRRPYLWTYPMANDRQFAMLGNWYCARLAGRNAIHAGDPVLQMSPRKAGIILLHANWEGTSAEPMNAQLASCGARTDEVIEAKWTGNGAGSGDAVFLENAVLQMKTAGVTTLACLCVVDYYGTTLRAATNQGYFPEWLLTSYMDNESSWWVPKFGGPEQTSHLMLVLQHPMDRHYVDHPSNWAVHEITGEDPPPTSWAQWGHNLDYWPLLLLASGFQMAGPHLTPETFERGLHQARFPNPQHRIMAGAVGFNDGDHTMTDDAAEVWWSNTAPNPYGEAAGAYCYIDGGARRRIGTFPSGDPFFQGPCDTGAG